MVLFCPACGSEIRYSQDTDAKQISCPSCSSPLLVVEHAGSLWFEVLEGQICLAELRTDRLKRIKEIDSEIEVLSEKSRVMKYWVVPIFIVAGIAIIGTVHLGYVFPMCLASISLFGAPALINWTGGVEKHGCGGSLLILVGFPITMGTFGLPIAIALVFKILHNMHLIGHLEKERSEIAAGLSS